MIALDPRAGTGSFDYVLKRDRELPKEQQTTWHLRALTESEWARVLDLVYVGTGEEPAGVATVSIETLRRGLVGATNLLGPDGKPLPVAEMIAAGGVTDEVLSRIPWSARLELATQIEAGTRVSEADVEKSEPSPTA